MKTFKDFNIDVGNKTTGKIKTQCPKCSHTRKNKRDKCLSVDFRKGPYGIATTAVGEALQNLRKSKNILFLKKSN